MIGVFTTVRCVHPVRLRFGNDMKARALALFFIASSMCMGVHGAEAPKPSWAAGSTSLGAAGLSAASRFAVASPDHAASVLYADSGLWLYVNGKKSFDLSSLVDSVYLTEVEWAKDSSAFFINASAGGAVGDWSTHVYSVGRGGIRELPIAGLVNDGSLQSNCQLNLVSIAWLDGHRKLLVLEQIPDTSSCTNMGKIAGYVIDLKMRRVAQRLTAAAVRGKYRSYLGAQALAAVSGSN